MILRLQPTKLRCHPIAPYWNWNIFVYPPMLLVCAPSNRTILELKQQNLVFFYVRKKTSNRTILELKQQFKKKLKRSGRNIQSHHTGIETSFERRSNKEIGSIQSHHTGIETKHGEFGRICRRTHPIAPYWNWNWGIINHKNYDHEHPIAPYWNWNSHIHAFWSFLGKHPIAPYWNWNYLKTLINKSH